MKGSAEKKIIQTTNIPRPTLAFRVGVLGARDLDKESHQHVGQQITAVLSEIKKIVAQNDPNWGYSRDEPKYFLIDSLAEGTDQIAAEAGLELGFDVIVPIPFDSQSYTDLFSVEKEFHRNNFYRLIADERVTPIELSIEASDSSERSTGYRDAATILLENSDILIAVPRQGHEVQSGGTMDTIERALSLKIPVIVPDLSVSDHYKLLTHSEQMQNPTQAWQELEITLRHLVLNVIAPHRQLNPDEEAKLIKKSEWDLKKIAEAIEHREDFFMANAMHPSKFVRLRSELPRWLYSCAWKLCDGIGHIGVRVESYFESENEQIKPIAPEQRKSGDKVTDTIKAIRHSYNAKYDLTDHLAVHYMELYRGAFVTNYMLGALAVLFALLSVKEPAWLLGEIIALALIAITFYLDRKYKWHTKGLEYRYLAESFRQMLYLAPLLRRLPVPRIGAHNRYGDPNASWMNWYFNAVVRENGLVSRGISGNQYDSSQFELSDSYLECMVNEIAENWLADQRRYHESTAHRFRFIHKILHGFTIFLFIVVASIVLYHCADIWFISTEPTDHWVTTILLAGLPAFIAAIHSIAIQGEFERLEDRSEDMRYFLSEEFENVKLLEKQKPPNFSIKLGIKAQEVSRAMLEELAEWRIMYLNRSSELA